MNPFTLLLADLQRQTSKKTAKDQKCPPSLRTARRPKGPQDSPTPSQAILPGSRQSLEPGVQKIRTRRCSKWESVDRKGSQIEDRCFFAP